MRGYMERIAEFQKVSFEQFAAAMKDIYGESRELERVYLLKTVDTNWMDHIDNMENLKQGIRLRAFAQRDPVVEYRNDGSDMFDEMIEVIKENTVKLILANPQRVFERLEQQKEIMRIQEERA